MAPDGEKKIIFTLSGFVQAVSLDDLCTFKVCTCSKSMTLDFLPHDIAVGPQGHHPQMKTNRKEEHIYQYL